jgi:transposase
MRAGAEYFVQPGVPAQRRYEALRCYFVEQLSAAEVGERFGYSPATVHQLAAELRAGRSEFFVSAKPGPKGPRKSSATIRDRVLVLRAGDHSVTEIADRLTAEGSPVSAQTVWGILHAEGLERLPRRRTRAGPTPRTGPVKARPIESWPAGASWPCDHAGLYLLLPAMVELGLDTLIDAAGYPSTRVLSAVHSVGSLLLLKCSRRGRAANAFPLGADPGLGLALGLVALPKATHLTGYSYRVRRQANLGLLTELARRCRDAGLYTGEAGFNLDFHAIRHHGDEVPLEEHYVPARSQRTRSVLTFFAQDHASTEMVYANADITKAEQAHEVIAFADYWQQVAGTDPGLLCFDSQLTTYAMLDELAARGITFLTLRQRGKKVLDALAALPASAWKTHTVKRAGRYRRPQIHEEIIRLNGIGHPLRQIAIRNIGHDQPTLLITNDLTTPAKDLFTRYAERMIIENELDADISGFHLNALSSGLPLNVDLDTTLTVLAGNCYRLLARTLPRYELATPDRLWRHFLDNTGTVTVADDHVRVDLALRTYTPALIDAGLPELDLPVPWWGGRRLRFGFPPR